MTGTQIHLPINRNYLQRTMTNRRNRRSPNITRRNSPPNTNLSATKSRFFGDNTRPIRGLNINLTMQQTYLRVPLRPIPGIRIILRFHDNLTLGLTRIVFLGVLGNGRVIAQGRGNNTILTPLWKKNGRHIRLQVQMLTPRNVRLIGAVRDR